MRVISVRQPWAWAIVAGGKTVENRARRSPWHTAIGETLAVHASLTYDDDAYSDPLSHAHGRRLGLSIPCHPCRNDELFPRGVILGTARLQALHHFEHCGGGCSSWAQPDQWHLLLDERRAWPAPVPAKGALGLWTWTPEEAA